MVQWDFESRLWILVGWFSQLLTRELSYSEISLKELHTFWFKKSPHCCSITQFSSVVIDVIRLISIFTPHVTDHIHLKGAKIPGITLHHTWLPFIYTQGVGLSPCVNACMWIPNALIWSRWARGSWPYKKPLPPSAVWPAQTPTCTHKHTGRMDCLVQKLVP